MIVLIAIATFDVTELAVSVTTDWTPPTSLARRLWISPVRVSVKNRSGIAWRCEYSADRRSCMTRWPIRLLRYDWPTPIKPDTIGRAIISPTYRLSSPKSRLGIASSISSLSRYGLISPMKLVSRIATRTTAICGRYGLKNRRIRRTV